MALNCPTCGASFEQGDLICMECGANLARVRGVSRRRPTSREQPAPHPEPPPEGPEDNAPSSATERAEPRSPAPAQSRREAEVPPEVQEPREPEPRPASRHLPSPPAERRSPQDRPRAEPGPQRGPEGRVPPDAPGLPQEPTPGRRAPQTPPPPSPRREETLLPPDVEQRRQPPDGTAFVCPHCESPLSNPATAQCETCLRPLGRQEPVLRLAFPAGELRVALGQHLVLGRDAAQSPVAATFKRYDNVSRRHSTVWLDPGGGAWVRDERSTNGTFVNEQRLPPGSQAPLRDGDSLRLAADASGAVHLS